MPKKANKKHDPLPDRLKALYQHSGVMSVGGRTAYAYWDGETPQYAVTELLYDDDGEPVSGYLLIRLDGLEDD